MKHTAKFFVSIEQNKKTCVKVNDKVFVNYTVYDENSEDWKKQKEIMLNSCYDVKHSGVVIDKDGEHPYWHFNNMDKAKYQNGCWLDPTYVKPEMIVNEFDMFDPQNLSFEAPAIGEEFYVWTDVAIRHCVVDSITVECDTLKLYQSITVRLKYEENGKEGFCGIHANKFVDLQKEIDEVCRKSENDFDAAFWYKQIDRIRQEYDEDYDRLREEYDAYRDWH